MFNRPNLSDEMRLNCTYCGKGSCKPLYNSIKNSLVKCGNFHCGAVFDGVSESKEREFYNANK